jgi:hypothetical protein
VWTVPLDLGIDVCDAFDQCPHECTAEPVGHSAGHGDRRLDENVVERLGGGGALATTRSTSRGMTSTPRIASAALPTRRHSTVPDKRPITASSASRQGPDGCVA